MLSVNSSSADHRLFIDIGAGLVRTDHLCGGFYPFKFNEDGFRRGCPADPVEN